MRLLKEANPDASVDRQLEEMASEKKGKGETTEGEGEESEEGEGGSDDGECGEKEESD